MRASGGPGPCMPRFASAGGTVVGQPTLYALYAAGPLTVPTPAVGTGVADAVVRRWPMAALTAGTRGEDAR